MSISPLACIILAAGKGIRMKSQHPKVLHKIAGCPMIHYVMTSVQALEPDSVTVVIDEGMEQVTQSVAPYSTLLQGSQRGTAAAVYATRDKLRDFQGDVLVLYGDTPLIASTTLRSMIEVRRESDNPGIVVLGLRPSVTDGYGRLIRGSNGALEKIVEEVDACDEECRISLCNSGVMLFDGSRLFQWLDSIVNDVRKEEAYLTDTVALAHAYGSICRIVEISEQEGLGVNTRSDLVTLERIVQSRLRRVALEDSGVTLISPETVYFSYDTVLGHDVTIEPYVVFGSGVRIGDGVDIRSFSHLEDVTIGKDVTIGPFARLRGGTAIGDGVQIGNFVEVKKSFLDKGVKVNHLSYLGDSSLGQGVNIGAGVITCNFDGRLKHSTRIGDRAFIGSNSSLVAPVSIGEESIVGAGSVITQDVKAETLAIARSRQKLYPSGANRLRAREKKRKK